MPRQALDSPGGCGGKELARLSSNGQSWAPRRRTQITFEPDSTPQRLVVKGRLRPAIRFESPGSPKVSNLQRRNSTALRTLGALDYARSSGHEPISAVQTGALAGGPAVDRIRVEVCPIRHSGKQRFEARVPNHN